MTARRLDVLWRLSLGLLVAAASLAAFAPVLGNELLSWDDKLYLVDNPHIRGLDGARLRWMLTTAHAGLWQPLTWLSFALDYRLWGLEPTGYHLTNLLLHAGAAILFYAVCLRLLTRALPGKDVAAAAALAAMFFAVHPLRVEAVAWATARKDVLSGFFWLAALLARLRAGEEEGGRRGLWEGAALASFALSLSAKATGLTLPLVLLVLEIYPFRRLAADPRRWLERTQRTRFLSLVPYLALGALFAGANYAAAVSSGIVHPSSGRPPAWGLGQALFGFWFYPTKTLWPSALAPYYPPQPWFGRWSWELFTRAAALALTLVAALRLAKRLPGTVAVLACYAAALLPVAGLLQHGMPHSAGDRFAYLPCLGFAVLVGAGFGAAGRGARLLALAWLAALGATSWRQCAVWRDSITLWSVSSARAPSAVATCNRGALLIAGGRPEEGLALLREGVALEPRSAAALGDLGVGLHQLGRLEEARGAWERALALEPTAEVEARIGASLANVGGASLERGLALLRSAVTVRPRQATWRLSLAEALAKAKRFGEAEAEYREALAVEPTLGRAHNGLGVLLARQGRLDAARAAYRLALQSADARGDANYNLGNLFLAQGRLGDAEGRYREVLRLTPAFPSAQVNLGNVLGRQGRLQEAASLYRAALKTDPRLPEARANLQAVQQALRL